MSLEPIPLKQELRSAEEDYLLEEFHSPQRLEEESQILERKLKIEANNYTDDLHTEYKQYAKVENVETKSEIKFLKHENYVEKVVDFDFKGEDFREELYFDHEIKEELVVGPVVFYKPVICNNKDNCSEPESLPNFTATLGDKSNSHLKPVEPDKCPDNTFEHNLQVTSLVTMGELATTLPEENKDAFIAIVKIMDHHFPKNWRDWEVHNLSFRDVFGDYIPSSLRAKIKFALPDLELARAFGPNLSERKYTSIRNTLIKSPLGRALIYSPPWLPKRIHGPSYSNFMKSATDIKQNKIGKREPCVELFNNRKRHYTTSDVEKNVKKAKVATETNAEANRVRAQMIAKLREQTELLNNIIKKETQNMKLIHKIRIKRIISQQNLARPDKKSSTVKETLKEERKKILRGRIAKAEHELANLQKERYRPKPIVKDPKLNKINISNSEQKKMLEAKIKEIDRKLANLQRINQLKIAKKQSVTKTNAKLAVPKPPSKIDQKKAKTDVKSVNSMPGSNEKKKILKAKNAEAERNSAKLQKNRLSQKQAISQAKLVKHGIKLQKLGQKDWCDIPFENIRHQFEATPCFTSLKVNNSLIRFTPKRNSVDILEKSDLTLAAITHGIIQQQYNFRVLLKHVPTDIKSNTNFRENEVEYKENSVALLNYTCRYRAEVIKARRDMYTRKSALKDVLEDIPPSETHLFDDQTLTKAIEEYGGIVKFFPSI